MKSINVSLILFLLFLFASCGRKQEEVKIHKNFAKDSTVNASENKDSINQNENVQTTSAGEVLKITSSEANIHINANAIVMGYVADVVVREKVSYLNFDKKYPKNTFSAVIFAEKFDEIGDLSIYKNQNVEIKGIITEYKGKPQIIVSSKNQISIVK
jgi:hypothetical protein